MKDLVECIEVNIVSEKYQLSANEFITENFYTLNDVVDFLNYYDVHKQDFIQLNDGVEDNLTCRFVLSSLRLFLNGVEKTLLDYIKETDQPVHFEASFDREYMVVDENEPLDDCYFIRRIERC